MVGYATAQEQWHHVLEIVEDNVSPGQFSTWFSNVELVRFDAETVEIGVANRFIKEWILGHYADVLTSAIGQVAGAEPALSVSISGEMFRRMREDQDRVFDAPPRRAAPASAPGGEGVPLNPEFVLDRFIVGPVNRLAFAAATAVVERPAAAYNPLFLFGSAGLGKTHLLQGICRALRDSGGGKPIYMPCEAFVNSFVLAVQQGKLERFRGHFRSADALIVDDIHFLAAKTRTQEEFFHTFDVLHNMGRQVVISSDAHPREISSFKDKLITRFVSGLVVELHSPDRETRKAIVQAKAEKRGLLIPPDTVSYIADNVKTNVRELEGAVAKLAALSFLENQSVDLEMARRALRHLGRGRRTRVSLAEVAEAVAEHFSLEVSRLRSRSRSRELMTARHIAMYLCGELTDHSLSEIGGHYGGRNHATVVHAKKKIGRLRESDPELSRTLDELVRRLQR